jgi:WD40 repeat protein
MVWRGRRAGAAAPDVKLLDFGLASRTTSRPKAIDRSLQETMAPSMVATRPPSASVSSGFSGTIHYMSPEQLDGDQGDHRADIFGFGCVLYEMLAGKKPFEGQSAVTVIASIMSTEPASIAALTGSHPLLDHVMRRCLEKDRERRWQSIGDVVTQLKWIAEHPFPVAASGEARRSYSWPIKVAIVTTALVVGTLGLLVGVRVLRGPERAVALPTLRLEITTPPSDDATIALTLDGTQVAFVANQNRIPVLWVRALDATESRALAGTEGASLPFWSPDGKSLGFFAEGKLKRIDVAGGRPLIATSDQKKQIVFQSPYDELEGQFSPDGKWVAIVSTDSARPEVFVQSFPDGRSPTQVSTSGGTQVRWSANGNEIFYLAPDGKLMVASVGLNGAAPDVKLPVALFQTYLATGTNVIGNKPQYAVSRDGRFLLNTAVESPSSPIVVSINWMQKLR